MMDQECINSIVKVISQSNMSDLNLNSVTLRPIICITDKDGKLLKEVTITLSDTFCSEKTKLSEAWVAGNLLLFTVFDGYLENKFNLGEGASFKSHYNDLQENNDIEIIQKNCFRIFKIIRNAVQHNLSNVHYSEGNYNICYTHNNTPFNLEITKKGADYLYTIVFNLVTNSIFGMYKPFITKGHFEGIIRNFYCNLKNELKNLNDDINDGLIEISDAPKLSFSVRYPVQNPVIIEDSDCELVFNHIENNPVGNTLHKYSTDYVYKDYLLPQEIGKIESNENLIIKFNKSFLNDDWKMIAAV